MVKSLVIFGITVLFSSCLRLNEESREHFLKGKQIRHGIVAINKNDPIESKQWDSPLDLHAASRGRTIYVKECIQCHGKEGEGPSGNKTKYDPPIKDLKTSLKNAPHFKFFISTSHWVGDKPGWKKYFSEQDIRDISHYLRSLSQEQPRTP